MSKDLTPHKSKIKFTIQFVIVIGIFSMLGVYLTFQFLNESVYVKYRGDVEQFITTNFDCADDILVIKNSTIKCAIQVTKDDDWNRGTPIKITDAFSIRKIHAGQLSWIDACPLNQITFNGLDFDGNKIEGCVPKELEGNYEKTVDYIMQLKSQER